MTENSNNPLTPPELFQRGIEITREIRGRIEEAQAYYLGRSSREPEEPLSEVFNPETGPILKYFIATIRTINRTRFIERFYRTAAAVSLLTFSSSVTKAVNRVKPLCLQEFGGVCPRLVVESQPERNRPRTPESADMQPDA